MESIKLAVLFFIHHVLTGTVKVDHYLKQLFSLGFSFFLPTQQKKRIIINYHLINKIVTLDINKLLKLQSIVDKIINS